ncbi:MAG: SusD/RagB family nutrient-binding outer membrane lipoprotein [Cyclobacteriaceae bacterium]|jgi:hypothetical protein|nr:SusD/RagB family nutrient-binding outer membrane lipoprotein [Cyclobacteriaceae bacterium]
MRHIYKKLGFVLLLMVAFSCDLDSDLQNPNQISVDGADIELILNSVEADFAVFYNNVISVGSQLTRLESMTGGDRYAVAIRSTTTNGVWFYAYQRVLVNAATVNLLSTAEGTRPDRPTHRAIANLLSAYTYLALVDVYGDVPQTEAIQGPDGNFNPVADGGAAVYDHALSLIASAKTDLAAAVAPALSRDPYYAGNKTRWTAFANTLELKAWMNIQMIPARKAEAETKIDAILASDIIDTEAENFTYKYAAVTVPNSRAPLYNQYYGPLVSSAGGYIGNFYQHEMFDGYTGIQDPRWRYIMYRQVGSNAQAFKQDPKNVGCGTKPAHYAPTDVFCQFEPGFYGRDHGDDSGTNPDSPFITATGMYPAGGKLDNMPTTNRTFHNPTIRGDGANGAGIEPIWMSFFTDYMKAEYMLRKNNDVANAKTQLATAIANSITQIRNFATVRGFALTAGLEPSTGAYQTAVAAAYDNAAVKMDVVGKEFWKSLYGNGLEAYNLYRRTGAPTNMQPTRTPNPGKFYKAYVYPATYVNLNANAAQKDLDNPQAPFWDPNLTLK